MDDLVLGTVIGLGIALPQLIPALRYYPHSIRSRPRLKERGIPARVLLKGLLTPRPCDQIHGLFFPEVCVFVGWLPLLAAWFAPLSWWHGVLSVAVLGALSGWVLPGFRLSARFCWLISMSLICLSLNGLSQLPVRQEVTILMVTLQLCSLLLASWKLLPMQPFCQRWERPSVAFGTPVARYLMAALTGRVSGLSYPLRTGQVNRIQTLGYNGGSQPRWMARLRRDSNPNGSGAHDWFASNPDGRLLDWYGVRYAFSYRPLDRLSPKWHLTVIPHLYENVHVNAPPSWDELAA